MKIKTISRTAASFTGVVILAAVLPGCAEFVYENSQIDARKACDKLPDWGERNACLKRSQMSYDQYEKLRNEKQPKDVPLCFKKVETGETVCTGK